MNPQSALKTSCISMKIDVNLESEKGLVGKDWYSMSGPPFCIKIFSQPLFASLCVHGLYTQTACLLLSALRPPRPVIVHNIHFLALSARRVNE